MEVVKMFNDDNKGSQWKNITKKLTGIGWVCIRGKLTNTDTYQLGLMWKMKGLNSF